MAEHEDGNHPSRRDILRQGLVGFTLPSLSRVFGNIPLGSLLSEDSVSFAQIGLSYLLPQNGRLRPFHREYSAEVVPRLIDLCRQDFPATEEMEESDTIVGGKLNHIESTATHLTSLIHEYEAAIQAQSPELVSLLKKYREEHITKDDAVFLSEETFEKVVEVFKSAPAEIQNELEQLGMILCNHWSELINVRLELAGEINSMRKFIEEAYQSYSFSSLENQAQREVLERRALARIKNINTVTIESSEKPDWYHSAHGPVPLQFALSHLRRSPPKCGPFRKAS